MRPEPNSTSIDYDVVVVGGGPSGATAAYLLAEFGHRVLVLERRTFPRTKVCGGGLTHKTIRLLKRVYDCSIPDLVQKDVINFSSDRFQLNFMDTTLLSDRSDHTLHFTRRRDYDQFLLRRAQRVGAEVREGEMVVGLDPDEGIVHRQSGPSIRSRFIIGADGAHSIIRKTLQTENKLSFTSGDWQHNLAMALEGYFDRSTLDRDIRGPTLYLGVLRWGYGWVFPHRSQCLIGLGGLIRKNGDFRDHLQSFFDLLGVKPDRSSCEIKGHPIPYGNYLRQPAYKSTLLVGDAAGMVDAFSAEGIFYAHRSGELAAWAIKKSVQDDLPADRIYQSLLEEHVIPELQASKRFRPLFFGGPRWVNRYACRVLLSLIHRPLLETVHGDRIYSGFLPRGNQRHEAIHLQGALV